MTKVDYVNIFIINEMVEDHSKVMNITKATMRAKKNYKRRKKKSSFSFE